MANIDPNSAVYATDEYGRPFIIVREGQQKSRLHGLDAIRVSSRVNKTRVYFLFHLIRKKKLFFSFSLIFWLQRQFQTSSRHLWDPEVLTRS
jgi:ERCC4-type nuclease